MWRHMLLLCQVLCGRMKDPVAKTGEVPNAVAGTFEDLGLVVAAFGKAIGVRNVKCVEDISRPVVKRLCTLSEFWKTGFFSTIDPVAQILFGVNGGR